MSEAEEWKEEGGGGEEGVNFQSGQAGGEAMSGIFGDAAEGGLGFGGSHGGEIGGSGRSFAGDARGEAGAQAGAQDFGGAQQMQRLFAQGEDFEAVAREEIFERAGAPAREVIGRVVERLDAFLPAIAVGDAQGDEAAGREKFADGREEVLRGVLVLEDFEKSDDVEFFGRVRGEEFFGAHRKDTLEAVMIEGEARGVLVELNAGRVEAGAAGGGEKISDAAAEVEQAAGFGSAGISEEKFVAGLKRHFGLVAALVDGFVPGGIGHPDGMPEVEVAGGAGEKRGAVKNFERCAQDGGGAGGAGGRGRELRGCLLSRSGAGGVHAVVPARVVVEISSSAGMLQMPCQASCWWPRGSVSTERNGTAFQTSRSFPPVRLLPPVKSEQRMV